MLAETPKVLLDRLEIEGDVAVTADITSVASRVFQYATYADAAADENGTEISSVQTTLAAACMHDTLQLGGMWNRKDAIGWNCRIDLPAAFFPTGGMYYRVEQVVQPSAVGSEPFSLVPWILYALPSAVD